MTKTHVIGTIITLFVCAQAQAYQETLLTFNDFRINTITINQQNEPDVDSNGQGEFIVLWASKYSTDMTWYEIAAQRYTQHGIRIGQEFTINQLTYSSQDAPAVAMKPDGGFIAVWDTYIESGNTDDIFARIYDANDVAVTNEFCVNQLRTSSQRDADIAITEDGNFMVVWNSYHSVYDPVRYWELRGRIYNASGSPLTNDFSITTDYDAASEGQVIPNGTGGFIVILVNDARNICAYEYNIAGQLIGSPHFLADMKVSADYATHFDSSNHYLTLLYTAESFSEVTNVRAKKFDRYFNEIIPATLVNDVSQHDCRPDGVDQLANGDYIFCWTRYDREQRYNDFFVRRFSSNFQPLEDKQQINSVPSLFPAYPYPANKCIITTVDPNHYAAMWSMNPMNDQDTDIFGAIGPKTWLADFDHNEKVDPNDLSMLTNYWLHDEPVFDLSPAYGDGIINIADYALLAEQWMLGQ